MTEVRLGDKRIPFIYQGDELIHPNPVKDGLVLWYDFSGRTNSDAHRGIAEDLSGNGNHGTLQNFNYTAESGYNENKLLFDGIDDFIDAPIEELNLDPEKMSAQIDNMIYSYKDGQVMYTKLDDARAELEGLEVGGRNLIPNSNDFSTFPNGYSGSEVVREYPISVEEWGAEDATRISITGGTHQIRTAKSIYGSTNAKRTFSIWVKNTGVNPLIIMINGLRDEGGSVREDVFPNESKRVVLSGTTRDGYDFIQFNFRTVDDYIGEPLDFIVWHDQLEKGNIATDWTPAPEDTEAKITTLNEQKIQSYKLYNRALTEEEIIHNFNVEKERFGIE